MEEAIVRYGAPEVFNTDQGAQFTSEAFTGALKAHGVRISMDGKGRWLYNVYVERLWRSLNYRRAYETVSEAGKGISDYLRYFNEERPHQGFDNRTPDDVFYKRKPLAQSGITRRDSTLKNVKKTVQFFRTISAYGAGDGAGSAYRVRVAAFRAPSYTRRGRIGARGGGKSGLRTRRADCCDPLASQWRRARTTLPGDAECDYCSEVYPDEE